MRRRPSYECFDKILKIKVKTSTCTYLFKMCYTLQDPIRLPFTCTGGEGGPTGIQIKKDDIEMSLT